MNQLCILSKCTYRHNFSRTWKFHLLATILANYFHCQSQLFTRFFPLVIPIVKCHKKGLYFGQWSRNYLYKYWNFFKWNQYTFKVWLQIRRKCRTFNATIFIVIRVTCQVISILTSTFSGYVDSLICFRNAYAFGILQTLLKWN